MAQPNQKVWHLRIAETPRTGDIAQYKQLKNLFGLLSANYINICTYLKIFQNHIDLVYIFALTK